MPADRLYLFNPEWQPVAMVGDYVVLIRPTGERVYFKLTFVGAIPLVNQVDFGAVTNGSTSVAVRALVSGVDILQLGPDGFLQTRFQLDPRDFTGTPDADVSVGVFQPGGADARWATLNQVGRWDMTAQHLWTSLAPTEIFSYKDETPLFAVTNNSGSDIAASRINFFAWKYLGELLGEEPPELSDVVQTRAGVIVGIPVGPQRGRTSFAGPA